MRHISLRWPAFLGIGAAAAIFGLFPWLVTGARLPLQNLWADQTLPEQMPLALLPFSQYTIFRLLGVIATGYAAAGLAMRVLRPRSATGAWVAWGGVLAVHAVATVQTTLVVASGLRNEAASQWYLAALLAVVMVSTVIGTLGYWLIARAPVPGAIIGLAIGAVSVGYWTGGFASSLTILPSELAIWLGQNILRWLPAVLVGAAIVWGGIRSWGRGVAAVLALVILWVQLPLSTAISSATGARVLLPYPAEMLDYGLGVLRSVLGLWDVTVQPVLVAIVVAAGGLVLRMLVRRLRSRTPAPADEAEDRSRP